MSVRTKMLRFIDNTLEDNNMSLKGLKVCTIGNLNTKRETRDYWRKKGVRGYGRFHSYLIDRGAETTIIDINPLGGETVLHYDLGRPILDENLQGAFDLAIDGGTGEHIDNQFEYWTNIFNLLKVGGISLHQLPCKGWWPKHARWLYDFPWFNDFMLKNNIELVDIFMTSDCYGILPFDRHVIFCGMRKHSLTKIDPLTFVNPFPDLEGVRKNDKDYNRWVLPSRANDKAQGCLTEADK